MDLETEEAVAYALEHDSEQVSEQTSESLQQQHQQQQQSETAENSGAELESDSFDPFAGTGMEEDDGDDKDTINKKEKKKVDASSDIETALRQVQEEKVPDVVLATSQLPQAKLHEGGEL